MGLFKSSKPAPIVAVAPTLPPPPPPGSYTANGGVMAIMEIKGHTPELLAAFDRYDADRREHPDGQLLRACCGTGQGIVIYDVWESQKALEDWLDLTPGQPRPTMVTIHAARLARPRA